MNIRYRVELSQAERQELATLISRGRHAARKIKRAHAGMDRAGSRAACGPAISRESCET